MPSNTRTILCRYYYDALDSLIGLNRAGQDDLQRFYCKSRLATEIQGQTQSTIMQQGDQILAQQQRMGGSVETKLLATDQKRSVLNAAGQKSRASISYSPYGHRPADNGSTSLLGFNGEQPDLTTGCYLLGNGHRTFSPVLMRFISPDILSPFGDGGLNCYGYCAGDPVNRVDPTGKVSWFLLTTRELAEASIPQRFMGNTLTSPFPYHVMTDNLNDSWMYSWYGKPAGLAPDLSKRKPLSAAAKSNLSELKSSHKTWVYEDRFTDAELASEILPIVYPRLKVQGLKSIQGNRTFDGQIRHLQRNEWVVAEIKIASRKMHQKVSSADLQQTLLPSQVSSDLFATKFLRKKRQEIRS